MNVKVHFLHNDLNKFPDNYHQVRDEQRERLRQSQQWKSTSRVGGTNERRLTTVEVSKLK